MTRTTSLSGSRSAAPWSLRSWALTCMVSVAACGCGGDDGPARYDVSGTVTYGGKPVPKGFITFLPDTSQGNSGPGGGAVIEDGRYQTESGKGVVGGPHVVKISGYDGKPTRMSGEDMPDGQPIFQTYQTTFEFPREDTEKDFAVPAGPG